MSTKPPLIIDFFDDGWFSADVSVESHTINLMGVYPSGAPIIEAATWPDDSEVEGLTHEDFDAFEARAIAQLGLGWADARKLAEGGRVTKGGCVLGKAEADYWDNWKQPEIDIRFGHHAPWALGN